MIDTVLFSSATFMDSIDCISPPGVLISTTSACAPSVSAVLIALVRKRQEAGLIWVFSFITSTLGDAAEAVPPVKDRDIITSTITMINAGTYDLRRARREFMAIFLQLLNNAPVTYMPAYTAIIP